jgi:phosphatidylglycerophosphatase A
MPKQSGLSKITASVFGIGYIAKGGGTVAAILFCLIWYFLLPGGYGNSYPQFLVALFIIIAGIWSANIADSFWGKDSSKVVIDEVAGMAISLLFVPHQIIYVVISLVAFRFFDIVKPLGVKKMESYPLGWGVMADDILAGIYALIITQLFIFLLKF